MNTDALFVGMSIKNYKELCMLSGEKVKTGKSKILQMDDFARYINWHKIGQQFIIDEIYDTPKPKQDKRSSGNNNVYCKYIEIILLNYLSNIKGNVNSLTIYTWFEILGMVSQDYNKYYKNMDSLLKYNDDINIQDLNDFYVRSGMRIRKILFDALKSLQKRKLICFEEEMIVACKVLNGTKTSIANDVDKECVLTVEYDVLHNDLKLNNIYQVYLKGLQNTYYQKVKKELYDLYGYKNYYRQIKIISLSKSVLQSELQKDKIKMAKEILNNHIVDFIDHDAYVKQNRSMWVDENYTETQMYLSDLLIKAHGFNEVIA